MPDMRCPQNVHTLVARVFQNIGKYRHDICLHAFEDLRREHRTSPFHLHRRFDVRATGIPQFYILDGKFSGGFETWPESKGVSHWSRAGAGE